jgi:hypothetical protein
MANRGSPDRKHVGTYPRSPVRSYAEASPGPPAGLRPRVSAGRRGGRSGDLHVSSRLVRPKRSRRRLLAEDKAEPKGQPVRNAITARSFSSVSDGMAIRPLCAHPTDLRIEAIADSMDSAELGGGFSQAWDLGAGACRVCFPHGPTIAKRLRQAHTRHQDWDRNHPRPSPEDTLDGST